MTKRERSSRPDRPSRERSVDALLDRASRGGGVLPGGDPARWQAVDQVLAALTSAPESSELTGQARALAEFRALAAAPSRGADLPAQAARREPGWMTWLRGGRPAVAAATGAVLMGGLLAVAYAGYLPAPAQRLAHKTIDAPPVRRDPDPAASFRPTRPTWPPRSPGSAGHRATHAPDRPDRRVHSGSGSGRPYRSWSSRSAPGSLYGRPGSGRQGQPGSPGSPGRPAEPWPTLEPSPSASISPSAGPTPSPSATPSPTQSGSPSSPQSTPP